MSPETEATLTAAAKVIFDYLCEIESADDLDQCHHWAWTALGTDEVETASRLFVNAREAEMAARDQGGDPQ